MRRTIHQTSRLTLTHLSRSRNTSEAGRVAGATPNALTVGRLLLGLLASRNCALTSSSRSELAVYAPLTAPRRDRSACTRTHHGRNRRDCLPLMFSVSC